jgi:glyoxylase-like metal-dependent hydrolase (beta-lactamase superfamily II)
MDRISLANTAFEGNNNAYLLRSQGTTALIDTGDATDRTREQFQSALADRGISFADVDEVFLTHWHGDHTGLAAEIQQRSGATVYAHEDDADLIRDLPEAWAELEDLQTGYFGEWGMPEEKQEVLRSIMHGEEFGDGPDVEAISGGETFTVGEYEITARHMPGHAAGLTCFEVPVDGERHVASADALLPVYTPNVGGADVRVERPLEKYLDTLGRIVDAEYDLAWPGHRDPIEDPAARAAHIVEHHEERAMRVLRALERFGPADAWTVSADLFGDLESIHILHGPGEAYAHL